MTTETKTQTHERAVEYAACNLIENGIATKNGPGNGVDLILDNGRTVLVRGMNEEIATALMSTSLNYLKVDYVVIATNLKYTCNRRIYMMTMDKAKDLADNNPARSDGRDNWFIGVKDYRSHREDYGILSR